jgi:hypothetical protein
VTLYPASGGRPIATTVACAAPHVSKNGLSVQMPSRTPRQPEITDQHSRIEIAQVDQAAEVNKGKDRSEADQHGPVTQGSFLQRHCAQTVSVGKGCNPASKGDGFEEDTNQSVTKTG